MDKFDYSFVKNPEIFAINTLKATSDHNYYRELENVTKPMSMKTYLDGYWKFNYCQNTNSLIEDYYKLDYDTTMWDTIKVPAHIQLEGYDNPHYVNTMYPWDGHANIKPGEIPTYKNSIGQYVTNFLIPDNYEQNINICFEGVETAFALWVNGSFVGYSEDSFTPTKFDITKFTTSGNNKLAVSVFQYSSGSWLEDQDFWRFSGIFRSVYLFTTPTIHLNDFFYKTYFSNNYNDAKVNIDLDFNNDCNYDVVLIDKFNNEVFSNNYNAIAGSNNVTFDITDPLLWSAEQPNLYTIKFIVKSSDNVIHEVVNYKVGFREFKLDNKIMKINGKRIKFNGVNRHEFSCDTGRAISKDEILKDVLIMKQHNINAVRTSHYPNQTYLYELCDQYGLYVIDEVNLETHGTWMHQGDVNIDSYIIPDDKKEFRSSVLYRGESLFNRDKNHASVIMWSLGNESYGGKTIYELSEYLRSVDDTRLIQYEGLFYDRRYNDSSDVESRMYASPSDVEQYLSNDPKKPFINCEFSHSMGNSNGNFFKYTELFDKYEMYQGGFIWDFIDQSLKTKNVFGNDYLAYGGDFNDRPTDYNFCVNGFVFGDRTLSPKIDEIKYQYQCFDFDISKDSVIIKNKNLFIDTSDYILKINVLENGILVDSYNKEVIVKPLESKKINFNFNKDLLRDVETSIICSLVLKDDTLWANKNHEVAFGQKIFKIENQSPIVDCTDNLIVIDCDNNLGLRGENFHIIFNKKNGNLVSYKYANTEYVRDIPKPNFWHAPTDNDKGSSIVYDQSVWKIASLYQKLIKFNHKKVDNYVLVELVLDLCSITTLSLNYKIYSNGLVNVSMSSAANNELPNKFDYGMLFTLPESYNTATYYGLGPNENYCDRNQGSKIGIHTINAVDNVTKYVIPSECGNRTEVRYAKIINNKGVGLEFISAPECPFEFSLLPYTPHELENATHHYELPPIYKNVVRVSKKHIGVAGDDSWGAKPYDEFTIKSNIDTSFEFSFKGIDI